MTRSRDSASTSGWTTTELPGFDPHLTHFEISLMFIMSWRFLLHWCWKRLWMRLLTRLRRKDRALCCGSMTRCGPGSVKALADAWLENSVDYCSETACLLWDLHRYFICPQMIWHWNCALYDMGTMLLSEAMHRFKVERALPWVSKEWNQTMLEIEDAFTWRPRIKLSEHVTHKPPEDR